MSVKLPILEGGRCQVLAKTEKNLEKQVQKRNKPAEKGCLDMWYRSSNDASATSGLRPDFGQKFKKITNLTHTGS